VTLSKWDQRFLAMCEVVASWSKDPNTKVGALIVEPISRAIISTGYNGLPRGVTDAPERMTREHGIKLLWTEHAERNAVYNAARTGAKTCGATMYMPWFPCADCARAIVQAGIARLVCGRPDFKHERWGLSFQVAYSIIQEGGIYFEFHN
jgi:dCMP deaminase